MRRTHGMLVLILAVAGPTAGAAAPVAARLRTELGSEASVAARPAERSVSPGQDGPDPRLARAFPDSVTLAALWREVRNAREAGLPTEPLVQKALEGWSKGAPDSLVVGAVRALRYRLDVASGILGAGATEADLVAAGGALYLGVKRDDLASIVDGTPRDARPMALVVLGDLVKRGVEIALANRVLLSLGKVGADAATLENFRNQVELDILTGVAPSRAAEVRSRGIVLNLGRGGGPPEGTDL